jgi:hypothetical protein
MNQYKRIVPIGTDRNRKEIGEGGYEEEEGRKRTK